MDSIKWVLLLSCHASLLVWDITLDGESERYETRLQNCDGVYFLQSTRETGKTYGVALLLGTSVWSSSCCFGLGRFSQNHCANQVNDDASVLTHFVDLLRNGDGNLDGIRKLLK
mmetsp:Transcript_29650/g.55578  ORF Transcript_29650/g.55578 Transcript_29650/m.55578 type:complete len:114 (+) Transcript_29650:416-757(+)